jgi:TPR repeat protein
MGENKASAAAWFTNSGDAGLAQAQCSLGELYFSGDDVEKDIRTSLAWF